jgi:DNA-directed RNA polymerase subunit omega
LTNKIFRDPFGVRACLDRGPTQHQHDDQSRREYGGGKSGKNPLTGKDFVCALNDFTDVKSLAMRDDYLKEALKVIADPNLLINVVSRRVKQLKRGSRPLVESLEKLSSEDIALREIIDGKISFETGDN